MTQNQTLHFLETTKNNGCRKQKHSSRSGFPYHYQECV